MGGAQERFYHNCPYANTVHFIQRKNSLRQM